MILQYLSDEPFLDSLVAECVPADLKRRVTVRKHLDGSEIECDTRFLHFNFERVISPKEQDVTLLLQHASNLFQNSKGNCVWIFLQQEREAKDDTTKLIQIRQEIPSGVTTVDGKSVHKTGHCFFGMSEDMRIHLNEEQALTHFMSECIRLSLSLPADAL